MELERFPDLLRTLDMVALICDGEAQFRMVGKAPDWFRKVCPDPDAFLVPESIAERFPVLANFLVDARAFWASGEAGRIRSGIWMQAMPAGDEIALEASAVRLDRLHVLLIEACASGHLEKQSIIQAGRRLALDLDRHRRDERLSRTMQAELAQQIRQRTQDLLESNARLTGEIEEREKVECSLRESEHRFRILFDNLFDAQLLLDADGRVRDVNRAACRLMSCDRSNLCGKRIGDLFPPSEAANIHDGFVRAMRDGIAYIDETVLPKENGAAIPVEGGGVGLEMNGNRHVLFNFHDISYRKQLQIQLQQAQKMEAMGTLASGIAHDFNNILSAVIGYTEIVRMDLEEGSRASQNLDQVLVAGNRAKKLIQQILTFGMQAESVETPVKIKGVITEALKLMQATLPATIRVEKRLESPAYVRCDPTQIHQICINLCSNAWHAMEEAEGGVLTVTLTDVTLGDDFAATHPGVDAGDYARLSVTDTGAGIPDAVMGKIFDPFFTTKARGKGTGMGLSVVHGIVATAGGTVTVENMAGGGCCFHVYLPVLSRDVTAAPLGFADAKTGTERILFVDDEPFQVDLARQLLGRLGYDVVAKSSSMEALALFEKDPAAFDLVITDLTMPQLSGKNLGKSILRFKPELPIILCSGFSSAISDAEAQEMGFAAYLKKPLVIRELATAIRKALDKGTDTRGAKADGSGTQ